MATAKLIEKAAALGVAVQVEKVTDITAIMGCGVMSTPGVVVDGQVVHAGGIPRPEAVESWLKA
ncbi:thioredoxin family protein [Azospirillum argentinense]